MAGTKASGRPGGNPDLNTAEFQELHGFKRRYDYEEPLTTPLQVKITATMAQGLDAVENKPEFVRQAIASALETL